MRGLGKLCRIEYSFAIVPEQTRPASDEVDDENSVAGFMFWRANVIKKHGIHGCSDIVACARHRRQQRDLQRDQRAFAAPVALRRRGSLSHTLEPLSRSERGSGLVFARSISRR